LVAPGVIWLFFCAPPGKKKREASGDTATLLPRERELPTKTPGGKQEIVAPQKYYTPEKHW